MNIFVKIVRKVMLSVSIVYVLFILSSLFFAVKRFASFGWGVSACVFWVLIVLVVIFARDLYIKRFLALLEKASFLISSRFNWIIEDISLKDYCDSEVIEK
ncbi:MAG: hypothetical protein C0174_06810 [Thermodesulfobium narugense]|nr:MAG: hypothetical protein C0174_06810 [Thermodesulfobium narugense]